MKTIKQIAEELKVSKQAVYKRYKGKLYTEVYPYTHTENGVVYIDEQGESIIKQDFLKNIPNTDTHTEYVQKPHTEYIQGHSGADTEYIPKDDMISLLKEQIEDLKKDKEKLEQKIEEKDKELTECRKDLSKYLDQSQHLQAQVNNRLLEKESGAAVDISSAEPEPQEKKKKGIFSFFKKKEV